MAAGNPKRMPFTKATPERKSKMRIYRSRARWDLWTKILQHPLTHAELGKKLGDAGLWQIRKWAYGFRRTMPVRLGFAVSKEFGLPIQSVLSPDQLSEVREIQNMKAV